MIKGQQQEQPQQRPRGRAPDAASDSLAHLLASMAGGGTPRVRRLLGLLGAAGLESGSHFLASTETDDGRGAVKAKLAAADMEDLPIPEFFVDSLRVAVEDNRLAFSGFPGPPPRTRVKVLFSAPHSLPLKREGHRTHAPEAGTSQLARDLAKVVGGAFLTWSQKEERRIAALKREVGEPDPTNKDPNFTGRDELRSSPWARNLREVRALLGPGPCFHVDLHGCKDPSPTHGSHLVVGLRAMQFANRPGVEELRSTLGLVFAVALRGWSVNVQPRAALTGAWDDDRCTLTQQSLSEEGGAWTHAVQLEMSRTLRNALKERREVRELFAQALRLAWCLVSETPDLHLDGMFEEVSAFVESCGRVFPEEVDACEREIDIACSVAKEAAKRAVRRNAEDPDNEPADLEGEGGGGGTANMEEAVPPSTEHITVIGAALARHADRVQCLVDDAKRRGTVGASARARARADPVASTVSLLLDWLRMPEESHEATYFIAGTWCKEPIEMSREPQNRFVHVVTIGEAHRESFQILLGGRRDTAIYPSVQDANPLVPHAVVGPDSGGRGVFWTMGHGGAARAGERYKIVLEAGAQSQAMRLTWARLGQPGA